MESELFKNVFYPVKDELFSYAISLSKDQNDAEDLLQDTWVKAIRNETKYDSVKGSAVTWLMTIMRNVFLSGKNKKTAKIKFEKENSKNISVNASESDEELNKYSWLFRKYVSEGNDGATKLLLTLYKISNKIDNLIYVQNEKIVFNKDFFTVNPIHHRRILYRISILKNSM